MDDTSNSTEDVEVVYETWRRGISLPSLKMTQDGSIDQAALEPFVKSTFMAGWIARGRMAARTGAGR